MWAMFIIDGHPLCCEFPHLFQTSKEIEIEHFISVRAIEPFKKGILSRASRLNVIDQHPISLPPVLEGLSQELWPLSTRII